MTVGLPALLAVAGLIVAWDVIAKAYLYRWVVLVGLALWGVRRRAMWSFGLLWYLVGHSLESSLLSLELVFEHRNYVPSFGILFAGAYYLPWRPIPTISAIPST